MSFAKEMKDFISAMSATSKISQGWTDTKYKELKMQYLQQQIKDYPQNMEFKRSLMRMQMQQHQLQMEGQTLRNKYLPQEQEDKHKSAVSRQRFYDRMAPTAKPDSGAGDAIKDFTPTLPGAAQPPAPAAPVTGPKSAIPITPTQQTGENDDDSEPDQNQNVGMNDDDGDDDDAVATQSAATGGLIDVPDDQNENDDFNPEGEKPAAIPSAPAAAPTKAAGKSDVPSIDRSWAQEELKKNPALTQRMANMVAGEVGLGHDPMKERIQLETAFNRAQARGIPLSQSLLSVGESHKGYYARDTYTNHRPVSQQQLDYFQKNVLAPVLGGSNTSQKVLGFVATGNASEGRSNYASRRAASGLYTNHAWYGPEMYVTENNKHDTKFASGYGGSRQGGRIESGGFASGYGANGEAMPPPNYSHWQDPDKQGGGGYDVASRGSAIPIPHVGKSKDLGIKTPDLGQKPGQDASTNYPSDDTFGPYDGNGALDHNADLPANDGPGTALISSTGNSAPGVTGTSFDTASPAGADFSPGGQYSQGGMVQSFAEGGMVGEGDDDDMPSADDDTETAIPATSQGNQEEPDNSDSEDYQAQRDMQMASAAGGQSGDTGGVPYSMEAGRDAVATGLAMRVAAAKKAPPSGATPGIPPSPAVHEKTTRYGTSTGGEVAQVTPQEMSAIKQRVQAAYPNRKLSEGELNMGAYSFMQQYYMSRGDEASLRAAGRMADAMLHYNQRAWTAYMPLAAAAADSGDLQGAATAMSKAYAQVPNGTELKFTPGKDGQTLDYQVVRYADGKAIHQGTLGVQQIGQMAKQWGGPGTFDKLVQESVKGPAAPDQTVKANTMSDVRTAGKMTDGADTVPDPTDSTGGKTKSIFPAGMEKAGQGVMQDIFASTTKLGKGAVTPSLAGKAAAGLFDPGVEMQIKPQQDGGALIRMPGSQVTMRISPNAFSEAMAIRGKAQGQRTNSMVDEMSPDLGTQQGDNDAAAEGKALQRPAAGLPVDQPGITAARKPSPVKSRLNPLKGLPGVDDENQ